jgi:hypothetical protein
MTTLAAAWAHEGGLPTAWPSLKPVDRLPRRYFLPEHIKTKSVTWLEDNQSRP